MLASLVPLVADHSALGAPSLPRLTVGDVSVNEGDAGKTVVHVPIDLDVAATAKTYVSWKISGGSATPRVDFSVPKAGFKLGKSAIGAKKTEAFVSVTIFGDTIAEPDETLFVDVTAVAGVTVERSRGTVTVENDDGPVGGAAGRASVTTPRLSIGTPSISEGNAGVRHAPVPVTLSIPAPAPISVTFETPGTDGNGDDESCDDPTKATVGDVTTTINFKTGQQSAYVKVPVLGNIAIDAAVRDVADSASVVSGTATVAQPDSDIVLMDDDTASPTASPPPIGTSRVSEPADGSNPTFSRVVANLTGCGYPQSTAASISADGRFVVFTSNADDLVGNDTNGESDVFVKDTWTGTVERVDVAVDGTQADAPSDATAISADGRFVLFSSYADNLVPGDTNGWRDAFIDDRQTGALQRVADTATGNTGTDNASISADDRYVVFTSGAPLTGGCTTCPGVFVLDRTTSAISLVSSSSTGSQLSWGYFPAISGDGRHVAFIGPDILGADQVFEKDLDTGNLVSISVNNAGHLGTGMYGSYPIRPALSSDGQQVAFTGQYCNFGLPSLQCGDGTGVYGDQVWVRDRTAGTTTLASVSSDGAPEWAETLGPSISADGRYVLFDADNASFAPECPQSGPDAGGTHDYQRDLALGTTTRVDVMAGVAPTCPSESYSLSNQAMSADGSYVTYTAMVGTEVSASNPEAVYVTRLR